MSKKIVYYDSNGTVLVQGTEPSKSNIETILGIKQKCIQ